MSEVAISVQNISKRYTIGTKSDNLYGQLAYILKNLGPGRNKATSKSDFWALKDISFEVETGEVLGVIGRNGAGKSTLLKIISRITHPTQGRFMVDGRVSSLLEVGTGFHPELTGRENIFLNGTILGMSKREINTKFEEIVEFSGVEKFLETPVKHYSSGMYVRLAFSVAAHLEPDILIIDEVLAVGDAAFQKKCLGKMKNVAELGRTVMFVSHNMLAVRELCSSCMLLDRGRLVEKGDVAEVIHGYNKLVSEIELKDTNLDNRKNRTSGDCVFTDFKILNGDQFESHSFVEGDVINIKLSAQTKHHINSLGLYLSINDILDQQPITTFIQGLSQEPIDKDKKINIDFNIPNLTLRSGNYSLYIALGDYECLKFHDVIDHNVDLPGISVSSNSPDLRQGLGYITLPHSCSMTIK